MCAIWVSEWPHDVSNWASSSAPHAFGSILLALVRECSPEGGPVQDGVSRLGTPCVPPFFSCDTIESTML